MNATTRIARAMAALGISAPLIALAAVPPVDSVGRGALIRCGATNGVIVRASHADKIVFAISGPLMATIAGDQPALDAIPRDEPLDIKVLDDPKTVADLNGKVLTFLGAMNTPQNRLAIKIHEVKYAMVCPTTDTP